MSHSDQKPKPIAPSLDQQVTNSQETDYSSVSLNEALDPAASEYRAQSANQVADVRFLQDCYAAVDLGSNSFHLVISQYQHGQFIVIDRQREVVRLAGGLDRRNHLNEETLERALLCLERFGQLLRDIPAQNVRAVGTNALRRLQSKSGFMVRAERALGHSIEIIAGREEARLVYLGVSKWAEYEDEARLVIDIGGGSTEIIAGKGDIAYCRESLEVGCVILSNQIFSDGKLTAKRFDKAKLTAKLAIQPVVSQFRLQGWSQAIGCSGTMKAIATVLIENGWSKDGLHSEGLRQLLAHAVAAGHVDNLELSGLTRDRIPVFAGGLAIILALFELFELKEMSVSDIALREGVLYDLVGRDAPQDVRDTTVNAMSQKWNVDTAHGERVRVTALKMYKQVAAIWDIQDEFFEDILGWSAQLHEVGLSISHDGYNKHGAYLMGNADMAGFARRDQLLLSALISGHRRKFPLELFEDLPSTLVTPAKRVAVILRLAVLIHRGRVGHGGGEVNIDVDGRNVSLKFSYGWLEQNPLTEADLKQEQSWLKQIGLKLDFQ
jgi:exopolyphosphatase/guanosine-5'-triphosphate,3'-diphosphate pyrophosphatase